MTVSASEFLLRNAIKTILAANDDFRAGMPADWEGDQLQEACDDARKLLGDDPAHAFTPAASSVRLEMRRIEALPKVGADAIERLAAYAREVAALRLAASTAPVTLVRAPPADEPAQPRNIKADLIATTSYLIRKRSAPTKPAHLWTGADTYCRMASTGGLNKRKYDVTADRGGRPICSMCASVDERRKATT